MPRRVPVTVYYDPEELDIKEVVQQLSEIEDSPYYKRTVSRICEMLLFGELTKVVKKYKTQMHSLADK